jgi:hypothetical protein
LTRHGSSVRLSAAAIWVWNFTASAPAAAIASIERVRGAQTAVVRLADLSDYHDMVVPIE